MAYLQNLLGPAGKEYVVQVLDRQDNQQRTTTSTSFYFPADYELAITPFHASSKILVHVSCGMGCNKTTGTNASGRTVSVWALRRDSTTLMEQDICFYQQSDGSTATGFISGEAAHMSFLDEPSTTSAVTYKMGFRSGSATFTTTACYRSYASSSYPQFHMTLEEIYSA